MLSVAFNNRVKLWVDDKLLIEGDTGDSFEKEKSATVKLEAGKKVPIRIEYAYTSGNASLRLSWAAKGIKKQVVPKERLSPAAGEGRGLGGEYFAVRGLEGQPVASRTRSWTSGGERPARSRRRSGRPV